MKIDPTRRSGISGTKRAGSGAKGVSGDFANLLKTNEAEAAAGPVATAPIDSLIALQGVTDQGGGGNSQARHRAELMLERLEEIRTGLLLGSIPQSRLQELASAARQSREANVDPALGEVLDDIELRARVELAKFEASDS